MISIGAPDDYVYCHFCPSWAWYQYNRRDAPILRKGNKGVRVKNLQTCLSYLGYKLTIDGIFGNDTFKKLKQFQKDNKLVKDGIYGEKSYKKMKELIK